MTMTINGSGTITGLSAGGLPDSSITTAEIASANVTQAKLETLVTPLGVGQTWTDVTGSRTEGVTYTNTTGRPIVVYISAAQTNTEGITGVVNGETVHDTSSNITGTSRIPVVLTVPSGGTYSATYYSRVSWYELR